MDIQAYFEEWSRRPGETVKMAISTAHPSVRATLVRLVSGPGQGGNPEGRVIDFASILDKTIAGRVQTTAVGSYARLPLPSACPGGPVTVHCWAWPTVPERDTVQTIWSVGDIALTIKAAKLRLQAGDMTIVEIDAALAARQWYSIAVTLGGGATSIDLNRLHGKVGAHRMARAATQLEFSGDELLLAAAAVDASGSPLLAFNGKIDSPTLHTSPLSAGALTRLHKGVAIDTSAWASWLIGQDFASETVAAAGKAAPGRLFNGAERGVTGRNWDGRSDAFTEVPQQYCALQFHDDDMVDAGWAYDLDFVLPESLSSGIYAVRLEAGGGRNHFPLFVRAAAGDEAPVLFLAPTNTHLAYANDHLASLDFSSVVPHEMHLPADEDYLFSHPEMGRSCYDTHADGTPVRYSSRRRPIVNIRPEFPSWLTGSYRHFPVDMYIIEWLEHVGIPYHVATDEDLDREGRALLDRHSVVVTGSHPEYWSRGALDDLDSYLNEGGRIMYLGGNGFYWVTSRQTARPWVIEVRRDNSGTRCWDAPYGERTHVTTNEAGGIWRTRGRAPNKMLGVGFASEGWSKGCGYRRLAASYTSPAAKFFEGVNEDIVGDYGHVLDGAVGDEIDRFDISLGSPEHAYVLATSTGVGNEYQLVIEDLTLSLPDQGGAQRPDMVRADMVVIPIDGGGAVFSAGSISYGGSLAWNECQNGLSRLTANVLKAFAGRAPLFEETGGG